MKKLLQNTLTNIIPISKEFEEKAQKHLDNLTKPKGSLGQLEDVAKRLYCIQGGQSTLRVDPAQMFTVAADHGIASENVSPYPQEVTRQMVHNFLSQGAAINVLCKQNNISLSVVDAGCVGGGFPAHAQLIDKRLGEGTKNFAREAAMSRELCIQALEHGIELAHEAAENDFACIGIGEMGITNTTSATALFCAYCKLDPKLIAGPGTGASPALIAHKAKVIESAFTLHTPTLQKGDAIDILATLGGFEIAVMTGIALGAAEKKCILMVDGFISTAAFVAAYALCPAVQDYTFFSHISAEPGYTHVLHALEKQGLRPAPLLQLQMRLGEGTGAALAIPLVRAAANIFNDMATFDSASVSGEL